MRAFEFLIEYRTKQYRDGSKPGWYEKAVQLKRDNPRMSSIEIGSLVGSNPTSVLIWLIGKPDSTSYKSNLNDEAFTVNESVLNHVAKMNGVKRICKQHV